MRILVVEDEKEIREFLKPSLEEEGFSVDTAEDGEKGLFLALTNDYDLLILDNMLPKKEGREVCKEIRKEGKKVPIIMLSVQSEVVTKVDLLNSGADDYLTKPFSFEELLARVKAILRRPNKIEEEVLKVDDLVLDTSTQIVKRGKRSIYLTRKEFALLEHLMKNISKVLSRGIIMEHVWDMNADPFSNTIESHILNIRKKIREKGKSNLIFTIPGRGYKIDLEK